MNRIIFTSIIVWLAILTPATAHAYFGPGAGFGAIAAVLGVIGAVLLGLFAIVYYPVKRALSKRKSKDDE